MWYLLWSLLISTHIVHSNAYVTTIPRHMEKNVSWKHINTIFKQAFKQTHDINAYKRILYTAFKKFLTDIRQCEIEFLHEGLSDTRHKFICHVNKKHYVACLLSSPFDEREKEVRAHILAAQQGFSPIIYYYAPDYTVVIMDFIPGRTISLQELSTPLVLDQCIHAIKAIEKFNIDAPKYDIFEYIRSCYAPLQQQNVAIPFLQSIMKCMEHIEKEFKQQKYPYAFCHNDLHPRNIFFTDRKICIIDWEIAHVGYALSDIAKLSVFSCLNDEADAYLLREYLQRIPSKQDTLLLQLMKLVMRFNDALTILCSLDNVQHLVAIHNFADLKNYEYYQRLFADDLVVISPEFLCAMALSQIQEIVKDMNSPLLREFLYQENKK